MSAQDERFSGKCEGVANPDRYPAGVNGIALGAAAACLISLTNVFSRLHFEAGSNPVTFLLGRYLIVVAALALGLFVLGRLERVPRGRRAADLVLAGLANVAGGSCLAFAIERIEVSLAVIVLYLFPLFTLLMSSALRRERPSATMLAALAVAFAGLCLALDVGGGSPPDPIGLAFAIGAATSIAFSFTWIEHRLGALTDGTRLLWLTAVGLVAAIALALLTDDVVWPLPSPDGWSTLLVATASFGAATAAMLLSVSRVGASATAMLMNLEPPVTVLLAVLLLGDTLGIVQIGGIALVLAAVLVAQWLGRRRTKGR